jgi:hypothetical protein
MDHFILAYKGDINSGDCPKQLETVAFLVRYSFHQEPRQIYFALDAERFDSMYLTQDELKIALAKIPENQIYEEDREFLKSCIEYGDSGVTINF